MGRPVRFYLNGERVELNECDPNRTVLQWLREDRRLTGTKEGCAEGDCGACTNVLLERDGDGLRLGAINSCIRFLPTLDGKALFTVEALARPDSLHPVQQAMVSCHASQCGFCTPGFVMSLLALYKTCDAPDRLAVNDALAGNLCRCTGYRPIVSAASAMYHLPAGDGWLQQAGMQPASPGAAEEYRAWCGRLQALECGETLAVTGRGYGGRQRRFLAPVSIDALAELMQAHPDARLLAGGTDLALEVTKALRDLDTVIYLGNVRGLDALSSGRSG